MATPFEMYASVVERALEDEDYADQLRADPKGTLEDAGFSFPPGVDVVLVEDDRATIHFVLPMAREGEGDNFVC